MRLQVEIQKQLKQHEIDLAFTLEDEVLGILGRSGCGKSITLKCIAGIMQPKRGIIKLDGQVLYSSSDRICQKPQKRAIGYLFQNYALFPNLTVRQNIEFAAKGNRIEKRQMAEKLLQRFYLEEIASSVPLQISSGQQQRAAIARMLAARPKVILLDEPFSALDYFLRGQMEKEMKEILKSFGGIAILVSHHQEEIYHLTDRCMVMKDGTIAEIQSTEKLFLQPNSQEAKILIGLEREMAL